MQADGTLLAKDIDRKGERDITIQNWWIASDLAAHFTNVYQGTERAQALIAHHGIVRLLSGRHGWDIAVLYDIESRESAARDHRVDLSVLDNDLLNRITLEEVQRASKAFGAFHASSFGKAPRYSNNRDARNSSVDGVYRANSLGKCFRCGVSGHVVKDCDASMTTAGKLCAQKSSGPNPSALTAPTGGNYCFGFARNSSCKFNATCSNFHGCSLCGSKTHGASSCTVTRK